MLNQKNFKLLAILLALALMLVACGGGDEPETTEETDTATDTTEDTADTGSEDMAEEDMASDEEIVLRIFGGNVG